MNEPAAGDGAAYAAAKFVPRARSLHLKTGRTPSLDGFRTPRLSVELAAPGCSKCSADGVAEQEYVQFIDIFDFCLNVFVLQPSDHLKPGMAFVMTSLRCANVRGRDITQMKRPSQKSSLACMAHASA
jgi:hypothetical protein